MSPTDSTTFDPYLQWLGIGLDERPIDHYRLLGVRMFEADALLIRAAADERMALVRTYQSGRRANESQRLLNELAAAKTCLLDPDTRATYDAVLQGQLASRSVSSAPPSPPPVALTQAPPPKPPPVEAPPAGARPTLEAATPTPFYFQPWFPVLVVAGVMLFCVAIWGIVVAMRSPGGAPPSETPSGMATSDPTDDGTEPGNNEDPPEDDPLADAVLIRQEAGGEVNLSAGTAVLDGPRLGTADGENVITDIASPVNRIAWRFRIERPGAFRIDATYSTMPEAAGGEFVLATEDEQTKVLSTRDTGGGDAFTSERIGFLWLRRSGEHRISLVPLSIPDGQSLMTLKTLRLVPVSGTSVD